MVTVKRVTPEDIKIKAMFYGRPGSGKTTMALQSNDHPALAPAIVLNFEGGLLSVAARGDVDAIAINSMDDLEQVYLAIAEGKDGLDKYKTVIIDSGSELYNKSLREAVDSRKRNKDPDAIEIGDYGRAGHQTLRLFTALRDLPKHVIVTAHPKFTYPQDSDARTTDPVEVGPSFTNKLAISLTGMFDFVWYLYTHDKGRGMLTQDRGAYKAKTRGMRFPAALGEIVDTPHLPTIYDLLLRTEGSGAKLMSEPEPVMTAAELMSESDSIVPAAQDSLPEPEEGVTKEQGDEIEDEYLRRDAGGS